MNPSIPQRERALQQLGVVVGDRIDIAIDIEAVRQVAAQVA